MTTETAGSDTSRAGGSSSIPPPDIGRSRIGRYEIIYPIAQGGMAGVWAGRFSGIAGFEKLVAIKVIHSHLSKNPEFVKMFLDEARLAAKIHHPNLGEVFEVGEDEGLYYMACELILGQNLRRLLVRADRHGVAIPLDVCAGIASRVCYGLDKAHKLLSDDGTPMNLVHRDVSPHNILISYDGHVKLIDFGVAFAKDRITSTDVGTVKGKVRYMAPEQIRADTVDGRTDLFALGIVLYQMVLGGRHPFPGSNDAQRINNILSGDFVPPHELDGNLPEELCRIIETAIQKWPENRFATGEAMGEALDAFVRSTGSKSVTVTLSRLMHELFAQEHPRHERMIRAHHSKTSKDLTGARNKSALKVTQPTVPGKMKSGASAPRRAGEEPFDDMATTLMGEEDAEKGEMEPIWRERAPQDGSTAPQWGEKIPDPRGIASEQRVTEPDPVASVSLRRETEIDDDSSQEARPENGHAEEDSSLSRRKEETSDEILGPENVRNFKKMTIGSFLVVALLMALSWQLLKTPHKIETSGESSAQPLAEESSKRGNRLSVVAEERESPSDSVEEPPTTKTVVSIPLEVFPEASLVELDGVPLPPGSSELHLDAEGKSHTLRVSAMGYIPEEKTFVAKAGGTLSIRLRKTPLKPRGRAHSGKKNNNKKKDTNQKLDPEALRSNPYQ